MTSPIPFLDADAIRAAMPIAELLDAIDPAYRDVAPGRDRSSLRSHVGLRDGSLLLMPGVRAGGEGASVKLVTIMPGNVDRGLPTIHALVAWFDAVTGQPLALLDGAMVTAMRTGAASGVATRLLARPDASMLGVIGAGGHAEWQIRAVLAARSIRRVLVHAPDSKRRKRFSMWMENATGVRRSPSRALRPSCGTLTCCAARQLRSNRSSMPSGSDRGRTATASAHFGSEW